MYTKFIKLIYFSCICGNRVHSAERSMAKTCKLKSLWKGLGLRPVHVYNKQSHFSLPDMTDASFFEEIFLRQSIASIVMLCFSSIFVDTPCREP